MCVCVRLSACSLSRYFYDNRDDMMGIPAAGKEKKKPNHGSKRISMERRRPETGKVSDSER